ncbi:hypothetical protein LHFGNBLO_005153 [Mesorhizobium sp. AR10]|uniref:hypothetical protein n=1 Tax=Mesorhizobium sp. AR10 TaxID=2865839 RepID=UPI00215EB4F5|nr:hypothetical protein [Mesorhizobium sp. AR10]UVK38031.1 hypothetical protein LHFGNBLO_005153 [Mesorhizobium sp. AR10]
MAVILIGALLTVAGVVYIAGAVLGRGRLSDPRPSPATPDRPTLEPRRRGLGFFGLSQNWPGLLMMGLGLILLLSAVVV